MEVLAGEPNLETEVKQHRARFSLDFSKVGLDSQPGDVCAEVKQTCSPSPTWFFLGIVITA